MAVQIGSARVDERGKYSGGKPGDQSGNEVSTQNWYNHKKGWIIIRAKDSTIRSKIAQAMKSACYNSKIGYSQSDRYGLYKAVKNKGFDPAKCTENVNTDCSALVRVCCQFAGITVGDFNTAAEVSVLRNTGKFDIITDSKYVTTSNYLLAGDILCTKTKGHTVVVLTNGSKTNTNEKPPVARYTIKKGYKGTQVTNLQNDLNYVLGINLDPDGDCGQKTIDALIKFQQKYNLKDDGVYGKESFNKMKELI